MERHQTQPQPASRGRDRAFTVWDPFAVYKDSAAPHILEILIKQEEDRTSEDIHKLFLHIKDVQFFQEVASNNSIELLLTIWGKLKLARIKKGQAVFNVGDSGSLFYVILDGKVGVQIPRQLESSVPATMTEVTELGPGQSFGELALIKDQSRSATIICKTVCIFVTLEKSEYQSILAEDEQKKLQVKLDLLEKQPMFANWTRRSLQKLSFFFTIQQYAKHETVFKEGDSIQNVYFITSGEFKISTSFFIKGKNHRAELAIIGSGEIFGDEEVSNLKAQHGRTTTAVWKSDKGDLLVMEKSNFLRRLQGQQNWSDYKRNSVLRQNVRQLRLDKLKQQLKQIESQHKYQGRLKSKSKNRTRRREAKSTQIDLLIFDKTYDGTSRGSSSMSSRTRGGRREDLSITKRAALHIPKKNYSGFVDTNLLT